MDQNMPKTIEEREVIFAELLHKLLITTEGEEIFVSDNLLNEIGIPSRVLWGVILPSLHKSGIVKYFNDPYSPLSTLHGTFANHPETMKLLGPLMSLSSEKIQANQKEITDIYTKIKSTFRHKFIVDRNKLAKLIENNSKYDINVFQMTGAGLQRSHPISGDEIYPVERGSDRYKVLMKLIRNPSKSKSYIKTEDIATECNLTQNTVRKTCNDLRSQINKRFSNLTGNEFIDSKRKEGYRINPSIKIIEK
jgi:hypothetical protein